MAESVAAGIVLYNPDLKRLKENLESVCPQVEEVILLDNASQNLDAVRKLLKEFPNTCLIRSGKNVGIAKGMNKIFEVGKSRGYKQILTLDDDSVCEEGLVHKLLEAGRAQPEGTVGIVCAVAQDLHMQTGRRTAKMAPDSSDTLSVTEVDQCITAGSLTSVSAWEAVGGFDGRMFIDFVDIEFCTRLRRQGYQIFQVENARIWQQYGSITGVIRLPGITLYRFNYSPRRIYYAARNQVYYMKKHQGFINLHRQRLYLVGYIGKHLVFENNRLATFKAMIAGVRAGANMSVSDADDAYIK